MIKGFILCKKIVIGSRHRICSSCPFNDLEKNLFFMQKYINRQVQNDLETFICHKTTEGKTNVMCGGMYEHLESMGLDNILMRIHKMKFFNKTKAHTKQY